MVDAFRDGVIDFSGMTGKRSLVVSEVVHKCFVEVSEEGTEASAATGVEIIERAGRNSESFCCNHPFLFLIKHIKTHSILFCGRVSTLRRPWPAAAPGDIQRAVPWAWMLVQQVPLDSFSFPNL